MRFSPLRLLLMLAPFTISGCRTISSESPTLAIEMALVPEGWFSMGSNGGPPSTRPLHSVFVSSFEIAITEVTVEQFQAFARDSGRMPLVWTGGVLAMDPHYPVTGILWEEASAFCEWYGLRLPTEAEWEKAARGTDQRAYPWGDFWDPSLANTTRGGARGVVVVGSLPGGASPYGILDMCGNVQEWVADYFSPTYYQESPSRDPMGPQLVLDRGLRGGSWASPASQSTTYFRNSSHSVSPNDEVGFRCARSIQQP
jgi:formylglycine-generating enzyme required for sulfatase activity